MINGICCCLQDSNSLVQRSVLDLINLCLPLNTRQITREDKLQLIVVAIHVVLRRDMSLNRRIYTWLMGSSTQKSAAAAAPSTASNLKSGLPQPQDIADKEADSKPNKTNYEENYFNSISKELLIASIKMLLNNRKEQCILYLFNEESFHLTSSSTSQQLNSFGTLPTGSLVNTNTTLKILKIVSNLVERQEIGQSIIDEILLDLLFYVYKEYCSLQTLCNGAGGGSAPGFMQSSHGHKRAQSNMSTNGLAAFSTVNNHTSVQLGKEMSELKKATCSFLFQSFQLYFIWDFCASKFEKICNEHTHEANVFSAAFGNGNGFAHNAKTTPAQLCDLYEFILDLLKYAVCLI